MRFKKIGYKTLNAKQKEIYNFQRVSSIFAELGFTTIKLQDDWEGADFIAVPFNGGRHIKVQLKGRMVLDKKYLDKTLFVCFEDKADKVWYLYPHDKMYHKMHGEKWRNGRRNFPKLSKSIRNKLNKNYKLE